MDFKKYLTKFKDNICKKFNALMKNISQSLPEILVIGGLFFIVFATFIINRIAGYYVLGGVVLFMGILLAKLR